jgi:disulfide bond formation protein DsbB
MDLESIVNLILGALTVFAQIFFVFAIVLIATKQPLFMRFMREKGLLLAFFVALIATLGSLVQSQIFGHEPNTYIWFQRMAMYPLVILLGIALVKRDFAIADYVIAFSSIGAVLSGYQYVLKILAGTLAKSKVLVFGFVNIQMMALIAFLMLIALMIAIKVPRNKESGMRM